MAFKVLIGHAEKGGTTQQQNEQFERAARHLEDQLNDPAYAVEQIQGVVVHDVNPTHAEIIAFVKTSDPKKKGV